MLEWKHVTERADVDQVKNLFKEYADGLKEDHLSRVMEKELSCLPGDYAPPNGVLFLVEDDREPMGCVAVRKLQPGICELKRLYVRPQARGTGLGKELVMMAIDVAEALGYEKMRLDTLNTMETAKGLYRYLGFEEIEPYSQVPVEGLSFFEKRL